MLKLTSDDYYLDIRSVIVQVYKEMYRHHVLHNSMMLEYLIKFIIILEKNYWDHRYLLLS